MVLTELFVSWEAEDIINKIELPGTHPNAFLIDEFDGLYPWFPALLAGKKENTIETSAYPGCQQISSRRRPFQPNRVNLGRNVRALVLKAPNLAFNEGELARLPVPVTIIIQRNPRAVVASMARLSHIDFTGN
jgi:hypothetical protein